VAALLLLGAPRGAAGVPGRLPEDAEQEHGYYLRQLFGQYGHNGTLPFEGLARLLGSLGLGTVRVVQIQHEELGHGHAAHLDLLEVQEDKHRHRHPLREHGGAAAPGTGAPLRYPPRSFPVGPRRFGLCRWGWAHPTHPLPISRSPPPSRPPSWHHPVPTEPPGAAGVPRQYRPGLSLLGRVLGLEHSSTDHPHDDCLNGTQLLLNFGLDSAAQLTPEQFSLLCPALLYQIDSRVCIQHRDEATLPPPGGTLWPGNPNPAAPRCSPAPHPSSRGSPSCSRGPPPQGCPCPGPGPRPRYGVGDSVPASPRPPCTPHPRP
uniref:Uncharacterized protein n=1 Tax=Taeniopygia guttata TaxID=59729 RepID=A0A674G7B4_TAEGU